ncbi:MAG: 2-succinyl-5-enolpyruvyl-6-hydroxy-3-cyclohexene-1-carboxylic-acid synthase [Candidatus Binatia bacterium]
MQPEANLDAAACIADELVRCGVSRVCISPGSRSAPLAVAIARCQALTKWVINDERSAAFFALGMARESCATVALLCTSGTAAANYLPAVAEASLGGLPLLLLTADRPPELRDCGAPQTIAQPRLFGEHVRWSADLPCPDPWADLERYYRGVTCQAVATTLGPSPGPVHLNLPFREPLLGRARPGLDSTGQELSHDTLAGSDGESGARQGARAYTRLHERVRQLSTETLSELADRVASASRGLIICGPWDGEAAFADEIAALAKRLGWPLLADPLSGLRWGEHDLDNVVDAYDVVLRCEAFANGHRPDLVIQFGSFPVSRALQDFLGSARPDPYLMVTRGGCWPDYLRLSTDLVQADAGWFCSSLLGRLGSAPHDVSGWLGSWLERSQLARSALEEALTERGDLFEGRVFPEIAECLPAEGSLLQVGNSMPVRYLDSYLGSRPIKLEALCNRGANGIDGVLSTALGTAAVASQPLTLVLGDLSFLHDIAALQITARHPLDATVVVINNNGGAIFSYLPEASYTDIFNKYFTTPHGCDLSVAGGLGNASFSRVGSWPEFSERFARCLGSGRVDVIELETDAAADRRAHQRNLRRAIAAVADGEPRKTVAP